MTWVGMRSLETVTTGPVAKPCKALARRRAVPLPPFRGGRIAAVAYGVCCFAAFYLPAPPELNAQTVAASISHDFARKLDGPAPWLHRVQSATAKFEVGELRGVPGQPIPVEIHVPSDQSASLHILFVRGLPEGFTLSNAVRVDDAWAVSPQYLSEFSLLPTDGYVGNFDLEFVLVWGSERTHDIKSVPVAIGTSGTAAVPADAQGSRPSAPEQTVSPKVEQAMLDRAMDIMENGDIAGARLVFERLAAKGSARGALAMAKTYDPEVLANLDIFGLQPNLVEAEKWYRLAAQLGDKQASERLATIDGAAER